MCKYGLVKYFELNVWNEVTANWDDQYKTQYG